MPGQERTASRAQQRARRSLIAIGDDLREARLRSGMTLRELSRAVGRSIAELSRVERGASPHVAVETLVLIGASVGLDVSVRTYPNGQPIRDAAQVDMLRRLRSMLPRALKMRFEVPLGIPGDLRAWDAVIDGKSWTRPLDAESRLRDIQALQRRIRLKCRDGGVDQMILVVADTRHNRHVLHVAADALSEMFPLSPRDVLKALQAGEAPAQSGIILV